MKSTIDHQRLAKLLIANPDKDQIHYLTGILWDEDLKKVQERLDSFYDNRPYEDENAKDNAMKASQLIDECEREKEEKFEKGLSQIEEPKEGWPKGSDMDKL